MRVADLDFLTMGMRSRSGPPSRRNISRGCRCVSCRGCGRKRRTTSNGSAHPPEDPWWDWAELRGRYGKVTAAVLNLSGWFDDAYGVEGAATNFNGLVQARKGQASPRTNLVIGPWVHGVPSPTNTHAGDLDFGPNAVTDYDALVLDFHDHYVRGIANRFANAAPVRHFVMGANEWRDADPLATGQPRRDALSRCRRGGGQRRLQQTEPATRDSQSTFTANPLEPVVDTYDTPGAHDYQGLESRKDLLTFETEPLVGGSVGRRQHRPRSSTPPAIVATSTCG